MDITKYEIGELVSLLVEGIEACHGQQRREKNSNASANVTTSLADIASAINNLAAAVREHGGRHED